MTHCISCNAAQCPSTAPLHGEGVGEHWWSGWPGAYCMKCGSEDPQEICLADDCPCDCHPEFTG